LDIHLVQFDIHLVQFDIHLSQFDIHLVQFDIHLVQFDIHLSQFDIRLVQCDIRLVQFDIHLVQFDIHLVQFDIHLVQFDIHLVQFDIHLVQFDIRLVQFYTITHLSNILVIKLGSSPSFKVSYPHNPLVNCCHVILCVNILCLWFRASLNYINNFPTRFNTKQSIYYSASSFYMFRVSTTPIIKSTQNCNYSLPPSLPPPTSLQRDQASLATLERGREGGRL